MPRTAPPARPARCSQVPVCLAAIALYVAASPSGGQQVAGGRVILGAQTGCAPAPCFQAPLSAPFVGSDNSGRYLVTHLYNPDGSSTGSYLSSTLFPETIIGVPPRVFASAPIPAGSTLNVLSWPSYHARNHLGPSCAWFHDTKDFVTSGNLTRLEQPALDGNPDRRLLVQSTRTSMLSQNFGVWYDPLSSHWWIFVEDPEVDFPAAEDVIFWGVDDSCDSGLTFHPPHVATPNNTSLNYTYLDEIPGIHQPSTRLLVTQLWSSAAPVYNDHPVGVWFDPSAGLWAIYNEDLAPMPIGARFEVATIDVAFRDGFEDGDLGAWGSVP